jgi:hypothetical protein
MLYYRFPGEEIVRVNGDFIEVDNFDIQGFIITDFNQKKKFQIFMFVFVTAKTPILKPLLDLQQILIFGVKQRANLYRKQTTPIN